MNLTNNTLFSRIRNYLPGDEASLIGLWNLAYAVYGGYVPRSLESWRWSVLGRPGVTPEDLMILQDERDILGYGVLGPDGSVLEFAVDPRLSSRERLTRAASLIRAIEERSLTRGDESIRFEVPFADESICLALRQADFYDKKASESLNIVIIDLVGLLTKILCHRHQESKIPEGWSPSFLFSIKPGHYRFSPFDHLSIQIGPPLVLKEVTEAKAVSTDPSVDIDLSTLTDLIFRRTTFEKAMSAGALVIRSISALRDVEILMSLIAIDCSWYTLIGDYQ